MGESISARTASGRIMKRSAMIWVNAQVLLQSIRDVREKFRESEGGKNVLKDSRFQLRRLYAASRSLLRDVKLLVKSTSGLVGSMDQDELEAWLKECGVEEDELTEAERRVFHTGA